MVLPTHTITDTPPAPTGPTPHRDQEAAHADNNPPDGGTNITSPGTTKTGTDEVERLFLEKYRALDIAGRLEQSFPPLIEKSIFTEYQKWQQQGISFITCFFGLVCVGCFVALTRFSLSYIGTPLHPLTIFGQLLIIPTVSASNIYLLVQFYLSYNRWHPHTPTGPHDPLPALIHQRKLFCARVLEFHLEDICCVGSGLSMAVIFLGRVLTGQCPEEATLWESQRCNPVALSHSFPQDDVIVMYLTPIFFHSLVRGVSATGRTTSGQSSVQQSFINPPRLPLPLLLPFSYRHRYRHTLPLFLSLLFPSSHHHHRHPLSLILPSSLFSAGMLLTYAISTTAVLFALITVQGQIQVHTHPSHS
jgi:hypothetical protein